MNSAGNSALKSSLLYLTLGGLLAAAIAVAVYTWDQMADVSLSAHGIVALVLGVIASLALGIGLMALVFYSHRKGYDRIDGSGPKAPNGNAGDGQDAGPRDDNR